MSYMGGSVTFEGGIQEMTIDEIEVVAGGNSRDRDDCIATWTFYGGAWGIVGFDGPWGAAIGAYAGNLIGNHFCTP